MECILSVVDEGVHLRALVATTGGEVVGQSSLAGPSNVRFIGAQAFRNRLQALVAEATAGLPEAVCLSAAVAVQADPERVRTMVAEILPVDRERVVNVGLERCALAGSVGSVELAQAVVVRADVASRGWGVAAPGREAARGGFGEVLGDDGSAFWIGRAGMRAAIRAYERRHRNTMLKARLLSHFGVASYQALLPPDWESPLLDRYAIAGFAPQVFEAAAQDDEVALEILEEAGRDLAVIGLSLIAELELGAQPFAVLASGPVFGLRGACLEAFMKTLKNKTAKANLIQAGPGPAAGGVLLAIQHLGLKVRPDTAELLRASLKARE